MSKNLSSACIHRNVDKVKFLLASGASANQADNKYGITPLHSAVQNGHLEIVEILIASGGLVNKASNNGNTPLYMASSKGHLEIVKVLIASGGLVNEANNNGFTPLSVAQMNGHTEIVVFLLREINWQRRKPLYLMRLWEDHKDNEAHQPTLLGRFLVDKNNQVGKDIKRLIASFL